MEAVPAQLDGRGGTPAVAPAPTLTSLSARRIADLVRHGEVTAEEVVSAHLRRIADLDPGIRALVHTAGERALQQARRLDDKRRRGDVLGPLAGVPLVVKDNIDVRRDTTASGSRAHAGVVALRDAPAVRRVRDAGAIVLGRANMDELAMGASTQTSAFGATRNPWDQRRSPGGSSGGSAAAVAAGLATLSIGTDTGGSIREPAAQCGVVGMAPSPGLVSMRGVVPFAPELDRLGPLARSAGDAALLLAVLSGRRELAAAVPNPLAAHQMRVGVVRELCGRGNQAGVLDRFAAATRLVAALGVELVPVSIPDAAQGLAAYMDITSAACVPLLEPYVRTGQAGEEVVRRWEIGRALQANGDGLVDAWAVQRRLALQAEEALRTCDVLLSPTMPTTAPLLTERSGNPGAVSVEDMADPMHAPYTDCWSVVVNLARLAAVSVPAGRSADDGMPVGIQLAGAAGSDRALLGLAAALEGRGLNVR